MAAQTATRVAENRPHHPLVILETSSLDKALGVILAMGYEPRRMRKGALKRGEKIIVFDSLLYDYS